MLYCFSFCHYVPRCSRSLKHFVFVQRAAYFAIFLFMHIIGFNYIQHHLVSCNILLISLLLTGEGFEETSEEAQCSKALDA